MLRVKVNSNFEKGSSFECGFDPKGRGHLNFSVRYFLIVIIFLIFDVEIAILLPLAVTPLRRLYFFWVISSLVFLVVLMLGILFEWIEGALEWKN